VQESFSNVERLAQRLGTDWPHIADARQRTAALRARLDTLASLATEDAATIMYGSIDREEVTESSDVDWTILIDGPSDPSHLQLVAKTSDRLKDLGFKAPGSTDTFAVLVNSHELIHHIAGTHDTNQNLTRRILLLFESIAVTQPLVRERVVRNILDRYITYDVVVPRAERLNEVIPHFLLNDVVRYWRTMASDYAAKMWERETKGWGLRNAKLRFSRKLIFVAGLLACFSFELDPPDDADDIRADRENLPARLTRHVLDHLSQPPLEAVAKTLLTLDQDSTARGLFDAYDRFLAVLSDPEQRTELDNLAMANALTSAVWHEVREASHGFRSAVEALFLENESRLKDLTLRFGVF
jgi:predicted nucleotidyltransferase